jgi:hypothetical protein
MKCSVLRDSNFELRDEEPVVDIAEHGSRTASLQKVFKKFQRFRIFAFAQVPDRDFSHFY